MAKQTSKGTLIIAGPGAGKTYNMVESIISALFTLAPCRYLAVITYTNSATKNIQKRLSKKITIPENLFIGTMHSFLNRFIVIPFSSFSSDKIGYEKLFMQCGIDDIFLKIQKSKSPDKRVKNPQEKAIVKSKIKERLNELGYITFDQTLSIAKNCMENPSICSTLSNRLQFLFVDEFQDSSNDVFSILEGIRKQNKTKLYCVGDPEQYIQSFNSSINTFKNIPILKASKSNGYNVQINSFNYRSTKNIVAFLNHFNGKNYNNKIFQQVACCKETNSIENAESGENVLFISKWETVTPIIEDFYFKCDSLNIPIEKRCLLAKKNDVINRITSAVNNIYMNPKKNSLTLPIKVIQDSFLSSLNMNKKEFCKKYQTNIYTLRKHAISIFKAINNGTIKDENTYGLFVHNVLNFKMAGGLPIKIENLKFDHNNHEVGKVVTVSNIHTIKGMESIAVLAIAKTEAELLLWIETDDVIREQKRDNETTDYCRLGYVAFSRAEKLLCIACIELISLSTIDKLKDLGVHFYNRVNSG